MVDVRSEPRLYGPAHPENSFWQDHALRAVPGQRGSSEAAERLTRHSIEVDGEIRAGTREGRRCMEAIREQTRGENRALSSATGSSGAFVTPVYEVDEWAAYRTPVKSFTNQTTNLPLPEYGLSVNLPSFTGTTTVSQQTENSGVSEGDPSGSNLSTTLVTQSGQVTISQQLFDRGGMTGLAFDLIVGQQLMWQLNTQIDTYVVTQALANAGTVIDASYSMANFYADIAKGREQLTDTNGVRMAATHVFSTSDLFGYITRQLDSESRPVVTPDSTALATVADDPDWDSWTGIHLPGALRWYTDDNIPVSGSNTQILVARPQEIYTFDGQHIAFAFPETEATSLSVVVGLRAYVGAVVRFPKAIAAITGNAYPTSLV
jgi:hypothetical protein